MKKRGGGILDIELLDQTSKLENYYQLFVTFETCDAMGANFINSILEKLGTEIRNLAKVSEELPADNNDLDINMCILSNYTPECIVKVEVECPIQDLSGISQGIEPEELAQSFKRAIEIARVDKRRAVTHNKGIMNGIDAVVLATGNDFRAVEAGVHAYASKNGHYGSLTHAKIEGDHFHFWIEIPLAIGTVGGLTKLHPLVRLCFEMLGNPGAKELMQIMAVAGLAQNFAALRSLTTTGIQKGHMKMHLMNILNQLDATSQEKEAAVEHFKANTVSHAAAVAFLESLRA